MTNPTMILDDAVEYAQQVVTDARNDVFVSFDIGRVMDAYVVIQGAQRWCPVARPLLEALDVLIGCVTVS